MRFVVDFFAYLWILSAVISSITITFCYRHLKNSTRQHICENLVNVTHHSQFHLLHTNLHATNSLKWKFKRNERKKKNTNPLTESLDIWIFNIGLLSWIVFNNEKSSNDHRQTVESWLDETNTSLMWLTCKPVTGPRWWSIFVICTRRSRHRRRHQHHKNCAYITTTNYKTMKMHLKRWNRYAIFYF